MEKNLQGIIESVLFAAGEAVRTDKLAEIAGISVAAAKAELERLGKFYTENGRGFMLIEIDDGYQICTRPEYYTYIQVLAGMKRQQGLSNAAFEALSIIAYNQPITRGTVEFIRGVNSDGAVQRLVERGLVEERGRLDAPGKPILYGTTQEFLRMFGLKTLSDLPEVDEPLPTEDENENQLKIDIDI